MAPKQKWRNTTLSNVEGTEESLMIATQKTCSIVMYYLVILKTKSESRNSFMHVCQRLEIETNRDIGIFYISNETVMFISEIKRIIYEEEY